MARPSRLFGDRPRLPRPVWLVSWTSFFTDTASEAVYPIMPLYLTRTLGGTAMAIGVIEGAAEALNSVLKILSGRLSDRWSARKPFVIVGYSISTLVRPMVALATSWLHVLAVRLTDRVGKGIRSAPRDALLASWADPATRGYVFGLHRAMDHAGAIAGPLLASLFLWFFPEQFRTLFALTIIPGLIAVAMLVPVPDAPAPLGAARPAPERMAAPLGKRFSRYLAVLFVFSLGNSTDAFLLLRLSEVGVGAAWIPLAWAALHVVKAVVSPIGGHLSDRLSRRGIIATGWLVYAGVYGGFALSSSAASLVPIFLVYGVYYGLTEGVEKAVVADLAPAGRRGSAFGAYHAVIGIGALAASLVFAAVWKAAGAPAAFALGAALALVSAASLFGLDLSADPD
ncbi:MAG: major facilitator superfamily 1 [Acidobacteria bacterium]|nr:major facilitator superfamily 1 [Acidobacteriota bacterium]